MKIDSSFLFDSARELYSGLSYIRNSGKILPPLRYIFELTYRCNLTCPFCYLGEKNKVNELTTEEWFSVIDQIPFYAFISFLGGEIFIREDWEQLLKYASKRVFGKVNIFSNGTLLTESMIKDMLRYKILLFSVSLDGIGSIHDEFRGKKGAFEKSLNALLKVKELRNKKRYPLLEVKSVILKDNLDELPKLYKLCSENGIDFITYSFLRTTNIRQSQNLRNEFCEEFLSEKYPINLYFDMEHFSEVYKEIESMSKKSKTLLRWAPKFREKGDLEKIKVFFEHRNDDIKTMYKPCKFPYHDIFINPEGKVYPCLPINMGSVREAKLSEIINSDKFCDFRKKLKHHKIFEPCHLCCDIYPKNLKNTV